MSTSNVQNIVLGATTQVIVSPSQKRVGLIITPPSFGSITLLPNLPITVFQGLVLRAGDKKLELWKVYHGDLLTRAWQGLFDAQHEPEMTGKTVNWTQVASAVNATATATQAAVAGRTHYVTDLNAALAGTTGIAAVRWDLTDGATIVFSGSVSVSQPVTLARPIRGTSGNALALAVPAGGVGVTSIAAMAGYSVDTPTITVIEVME